LKQIIDFFIDIDIKIMLNTLIKQIIFINNFNFYEKSLIPFKKFIGKNKIVSIFYKLGPNCINFFKSKLN